MVEVVARASLLPTEDEEKVRRCLLNLFPAARMAAIEGGLEARTSDLSRFKEIVRNHKILDSTRAVMLRGMTGGRMAFQLNKQAAFVGKVSFAEGKTPLGTLEVEVVGEDLEALVDDVAPRTVNGEIP